MLTQDLLTGYIHETPDYPSYGVGEELYDTSQYEPPGVGQVVYDGLGNPVGAIGPIFSALAPHLPAIIGAAAPALASLFRRRMRAPAPVPVPMPAPVPAPGMGQVVYDGLGNPVGLPILPAIMAAAPAVASIVGSLAQRRAAAPAPPPPVAAAHAPVAPMPYGPSLPPGCCPCRSPMYPPMPPYGWPPYPRRPRRRRR